MSRVRNTHRENGRFAKTPPIVQAEEWVLLLTGINEEFDIRFSQTQMIGVH